MRAQAVRVIPGAVATLGVDERRAFLKRTFIHLALAIGVFVLASWIFLESGNFAERMAIWAYTGGIANQFIFLGGFMLIGYLSDKWAHSDTSVQLQYVGLLVGAIGYAFFFTPIMMIAQNYAKVPHLLEICGVITLTLSVGLMGTVYLTKKDFSFLGGILRMGMFVALGTIAAALIFDFSLGLVFSGAMILMFGGYILYYTSLMMKEWPPTKHVSAALVLFGAIAMMFFYILRFALILTSSD